MTSFLSQLYESATKLASGDIGRTTKRHVIRRMLPVHPQHLFNIVTDVNAYSSFLPFCKYSRILRTYPCKTMFDATLRVGMVEFPPPLHSIEEEYTSRVTCRKERVRAPSGTEDSVAHHIWTIEANSIQSRFLQDLNSRWKLHAVIPHSSNKVFSSHLPIQGTKKNADPEHVKTSMGEHLWTDVDFSIEMTVSDPIVALVLDQVLRDVASRQVNAFEKRCLDIPYLPNRTTP